MEITKAIIKDNTIILTVNGITDLDKVYLDSVYNDDFIESDDDLMHTYVIENFLIDEQTVIIDITTIKDNAFVVTIISGEDKESALAIDYDELYQLKVNMIINFCGKCLNSKDKERIVMIQFRNNLLQYSIDNKLLYDSIAHYKSLDRLLNDKIVNNNCCL